MNLDNPIPENITKPSIIVVDIRKFTASPVTTDIGIISLGKYTFFIIFPFSINVNAALFMAAEKNVQGINPQQRNTV